MEIADCRSSRDIILITTHILVLHGNDYEKTAFRFTLCGQHCTIARCRPTVMLNNNNNDNNYNNNNK